MLQRTATTSTSAHPVRGRANTVTTHTSCSSCCQSQGLLKFVKATIQYKQRTWSPRLVCRASSAVSADSSASPSLQQLKQEQDMSSQPVRTDALVLGGGSAGIAAALMLARRGYKVTVAERHAQFSYSDPDRSYVYAIDGRGRQFTDNYGLTGKLAELGVDTLAVDVRRVYPNGKVTSNRQVIKDENRVVYWLPRNSFVRILEYAARQSPADSYITLLNNTEAVAVEQLAAVSSSGQQQQVQVTLRNTVTGNTQAFTPKLLLGCDGINSLVRRSLQSWAAENGNELSSRFSVGEFPSLSTNLRFKVLQLPPNPVLKDGTALNNPYFCLLIGQKASLIGGTPLRLGLLPIKDTTVGRTANLITLPDHPVWGVRDAETMYTVFEQSMPQVDWRQLVPEAVMAKFAASQGGEFPAPQYSKGLSMVVAEHDDNSLLNSSSNHSSSSSTAAGGSIAATVKGCGVVLLGDAAHCFPPDLGQGVNSALEDVCVLEQQLAVAGDDLAAALPAYEQQRLPDSAALAKLVQIGFPLQYNQYPFLRLLWNIRFLAQVIAHKLLPFAVSPPLFLMIQDPSQRYSKVLAATERSRQVVLLLGVLLAAAAAWLLPRLVRGLVGAAS